MGKVTACKMEPVTKGSGHTCTGMAVSVCTTPAAPSPIPIPYPTAGSISEGIIDSAMRTKIEGQIVMTVGSCQSKCHGNEPGTLKETCSLNTAGPCFPALGAPVVIIELGMTGITGSIGQMNKAITVGASGTASGAGGGAGGGGGGGGGGGAGGPSGPSSPAGGGGGGGGSGPGAAAAPSSGPTPAERELAARPGQTPAQVAARKKVADDFYKKNGQKWDPKKGSMRPHTDAERASEMNGIDFNKPIRTRPPDASQPGGLGPLPDPQYCIQGPGRRNGQYYSSDPNATPSSLGIGRYGQGGEKQRTECGVQGDPPYMQSTAAPVTDDWSGTGVFQKQEAKGGGQQHYVPNNNQMVPNGPAQPL